MFMAKLNKLQNPLRTYIILENMGRGYHIAAAFSLGRCPGASG